MWFSAEKYEHDIFISHAFEDKEAIANTLNARLKAEGFKVWYSGDQLTSGNDIHDLIEEAIHRSRFGVVIVSPIFTQKDWTRKELTWLQAKEREGRKVIFPVRHNISIEAVRMFDPKIGSKVCFDASKGIEFVATKIIDEIKVEFDLESRKKKLRIFWISFITILLVSIAAYTTYCILTDHPKAGEVQQIVETRISTFLNTIESRYVTPLKTDGQSITQHQIDSLKQVYGKFKSYYRNEYEFNNGNVTIRGRKNVETFIGRDVVVMADQPGYGIDSVEAYWDNRSMSDGFRHAGFSLFNKRPVQFVCRNEKDGSRYMVHVKYSNEIRFINVSLTLPPQLNGTKRHEMTILGFAPSETYYFEKSSDGYWHFTKVE